MAALELREVVKHYPTRGETVRAVDGVSLTVEPGEFVAIYGPSGSGKTTLLLLAAALMAPDSGSVWFGGRDVTRLAPREAARFRRSEVGFVFQSFHLMPAATAIDNAAVKLLASGLSLQARAPSARDPWLERVGLGPRVEHTPRELSKGECQRVAIARALAGEPQRRCSPTSRPATSTRSAAARCSRCCASSATSAASPVLLVTHDPQAMRVVDRTLHAARRGAARRARRRRDRDRVVMRPFGIRLERARPLLPLAAARARRAGAARGRGHRDRRRARLRRARREHEPHRLGRAARQRRRRVARGSSLRRGRRMASTSGLRERRAACRAIRYAACGSASERRRRRPGRPPLDPARRRRRRRSRSSAAPRRGTSDPAACASSGWDDACLPAVADAHSARSLARW